jgi:hypothetical protein
MILLDTIQSVEIDTSIETSNKVIIKRKVDVPLCVYSS